MAKNIFFEEICDGVLCEAVESFEEEVNLTNTEEEVKTVEKSQFVDLHVQCMCFVVSTRSAHFLHFPHVLKYLLCFISV